MKIKESWAYVGGLSRPSKLSCYGYGLSAYKCHIGAILAKIAGSVCSLCYAKKGNYVFKNVREAHARRLESLKKAKWVENMTHLIGAKAKNNLFRWHDSGDIQSLQHLRMICLVAENLPHVRFWLPTKEYGILGEYVTLYGAFPDNLTVRLSATKIEGEPPTAYAESIGAVTSGVSRENYNCLAYDNGGKCGPCVKCWDKNEKHIIYKKQ